jgi:parallel beta-helix repeat protein
MEKKRTFAVVCLLLVAALAACGGPEVDPAAQATEIVAAAFATLTAEAPLPTVVVTPPPPTASSPLDVPTPAQAAPPPTEPSPLEVPTPLQPAGQPAQPPAGEATTIHLQADGSGEYATLAEALRAAPAGSTIILGPGTFRLAEALTVDRAVTLAGEGPSETEIVSAAPEHVLRFAGAGPFAAEMITFRHEGPEAANVVVVMGGEVSFSFCQFSGGVFTQAAGYGGSGLLLGASTTGQVFGCDLTDNQEAGILLRDDARPVLVQNVVRDNGSCGLLYYGQAAGEAHENQADQNGLYGICLMVEAQPLLANNTCSRNAASGIVYFGQAGGLARDNECLLNSVDGIAVQEQALPSLEGNTCYGNGQADIRFVGDSGGAARDNRCSTDAPYGLYVADTAHPSLAGNQCRVEGADVASGPVPEPRYNPEYMQGYGPYCFNRPATTIDREWQVSAERGELFMGNSLPITLRNKWGEENEVYQVTARIIAPDGSQAAATASLQGADEALLIYPDDFGVGDTPRGVYTIVWEIDGGFVACDGFVVKGGAGW